MNLWMADPFEYPERPSTAARSSTRKALAEMGRTGAATRTSTATASRTAPLPGTPGGKGAYFTRGSATTSTRATPRAARPTCRNVDRLSSARSTPTRARAGPRRPTWPRGDNPIGIMAYGTSDCRRRRVPRPAAQRRTTCSSTTCALRVPLQRRASSSGSLRRTTASTWSSRTATPRCGRCSIIEHARIT